ncbi:hypothetical protein BTO04_01015 [Polaribacter sp. SA4-10]|uniref:7TM diverse intracellular signaling domain-containing protein n=1 Tax=Polaribacter sp. SA4-10 TaxID=754397 RepID=UPI000B3C6A20|nr:7TM diverse intracellular signaling domain-containing protein [Polaribacter sp. SA4-10]ARV05356.1 hypothetical protein BTO04_01015 [Polaribacter sp. SA4-10]
MNSNHRKLTFIIALISLLFFQKNYANDDAVLALKKNNLQIDFSLLYYKINTNTLDLNIVSKKFKKMPTSNSFGVLNGTYWFKLTLNNTQESKNLIAFIPTHNIEKIDIYKNINNELNFISSTGNTVNREQIPVDYKFPAFKINSENESIFYLKVKFPKEANFPLKITTEREFVSYTSKKLVINSIYYGTAIIIILINLLFFLKFKNKSYLYYLLFLTSLIINFLLYDGSLIHVFRGNPFYYKLELFVHLFGEIWFILFSIKFLNIKDKHPYFTKLLFLSPIIIAFLYTLYLATNSYIYVAIGDAIGVSILPVLWLFGIYYLKQIPSAKFYVFGYLLLIPFAVYFILGFPFGLWNVNGEMLIMKIASWLDIIVFTYAISYRMKMKIVGREENSIENTEHTQMKPILMPLVHKTELVNPFYTLLKENILDIEPLTLRELDILESICEGLNNVEIGNKLFISINTVKYHIRNIYNKAGVNSRADLKEKLSLINSYKNTNNQPLTRQG